MNIQEIAPRLGHADIKMTVTIPKGHTTSKAAKFDKYNCSSVNVCRH